MTINFPYPLLRVPTVDALQEVNRLRTNGQVPIILGNEQQFDDFAYVFERSQQGEPDELLALSEHLEIDSSLSAFASSAAALEALEDFDWPSNVPPVTLLWALNRKDRDSADKTVIAVLPISECWMAPCFLKVGDDCHRPGAHVHTALAKYWQRRYGAEIVAAIGQTVEFTVSKPPRTESEAIELALQHYWYADDHVCGHDSFAEYTASLLNATVWSFWWD